MEECYHDRHEKKPFEFPGGGGQEKQGGKGNLREHREEE